MSIIVFKTVTQQFPNGTVAFRNLDFSVDSGETVLITGPSGSGKTTIMRLLIGEYQPTKGEILFEDKPLSKAYRNRLHLHRRQVGVVFQDYKLIEELNVWENIALPLFIKGERQNTIEERVTDLLKLVELTDKALVFPRQLSGGEAQRISIARALANSPKVIFADEPTGNLDEDNSKHIIKILTKINQLGTTLILATHDPVIIDEIKAKRIDLSDYHQEEILEELKKELEPKTEKAKKIEIMDDDKEDHLKKIKKSSDKKPDENKKVEKKKNDLEKKAEKETKEEKNDKTSKTSSQEKKKTGFFSFLKRKKAEKKILEKPKTTEDNQEDINSETEKTKNEIF